LASRSPRIRRCTGQPMGGKFRAQLPDALPQGAHPGTGIEMVRVSAGL